MGPNALLIDYLRTLISVSMLAYASYKDVKTREIHDLTWIIPSTIGAVLCVYEIYIGYLNLNIAMMNVGFMVILSLVLWFLSLFGEADLLAFVSLSIIHPRVPSFNFLSYRPLIFSFTLIANSAIAGSLVSIFTIGVNIYDKLKGVELFERHQKLSPIRKLIIMFTGRYIPVKSLRGPPFEYPLEVDGGLILKPDLFDDKAANRAFLVLREKNVERVWVSSTLPYVVVLFIGYIISIIIGDVMFTIMSALI